MLKINGNILQSKQLSKLFSYTKKWEQHAED